MSESREHKRKRIEKSSIVIRLTDPCSLKTEATAFGIIPEMDHVTGPEENINTIQKVAYQWQYFFYYNAIK